MAVTLVPMCGCGLMPVATVEQHKKAWAAGKCVACYEIDDRAHFEQLQRLRKEIEAQNYFLDKVKTVWNGDPENCCECENCQKMKPVIAKLARWEAKQVC